MKNNEASNAPALRFDAVIDSESSQRHGATAVPPLSKRVAIFENIMTPGASVTLDPAGVLCNRL